MPLRKRCPVVLVVDDDGEMQAFYRRFFESQYPGEFTWRLAPTGKKALDILDGHPSERIGTVLLKQGLRGGGLAEADLLHRIKSDPVTHEIPVFIVSTKRSTRDFVAALEAGADEVFVRPFDAAALWAKLRATFRRMGLMYDSDVFEVADLRLDGGRRSVTVGGRKVQLEPKEFEVLRVLLRRPNLVHPPSALWDAVWGEERSGTFQHVLHSKISNIRRKLGSKWGPRLRSHRGQGYTFDVPPRRGGKR